MLRDRFEDLRRLVVEQLHVPFFRSIARILLLQHLNHHVIRGFIDDGNHHLLAVKKIGPVCILLRGSLCHLEHIIPGQDLRKLIAKLLHQIAVDIHCLRGAHKRNRIMLFSDSAFLQKLRHHLRQLRTVISDLAPAKAVLLILKQIIQRNHLVCPRHVGCNVIRIGDADIRCCSCGQIRNDVVVDFRVIRIQLHIDADIRIQSLEILNGLMIDCRLVLVRIVLGPERNGNRLRVIKGLRYCKRLQSL